MKNVTKTFLAILWQLPALVLVWLFYILPVWLIFRDIRLRGWLLTPGGLVVPVFELTNPDSFYGKLWRDWAGWAGPLVIILRDFDRFISTRMTDHEAQHIDDMGIFGMLFYPAYFAASVFIWVFLWSKHAYLDNPFERRARRKAKQIVDLKPSQWPHGAEDRWPWW